VLQEPAFLILTALADEPRHGYAIIAAVVELSSGRLTLRAGTLYAALDRFLEAGLVRVERETVVDGRARRTYAITETGIATLTEEVERLEGNAAVGRRFLRTRDARNQGSAVHQPRTATPWLAASSSYQAQS
jgi:PadR family transcriptional regulator, regulatory protein PadR